MHTVHTGRDLVFTPEQYRSEKDRSAPREYPEGVFGQEYPQNLSTMKGYASVEKFGVGEEGDYKDADRVGLDGLPHVGAVVWPTQSYYNTYDIYKGMAPESA